MPSPGFQTLQTTGLELHSGDRFSLHELKLSAGSEAQTVNGQGATEAGTLDSGEQSSPISSRQIQRLSVEGRDVTELLQILPGFAVTPHPGAFAQAELPDCVHERRCTIVQQGLPGSLAPCSGSRLQ